jgi:hypothetical protein
MLVSHMNDLHPRDLLGYLDLYQGENNMEI